jgi:Icc-related predicted phosphoesterase
MRILAISDMHGDLTVAYNAMKLLKPELLLCCGDWGDPGEITQKDFARFTARCPVLTTFGNHDAIDLLRRVKNSDDSPILLDQGEVREVLGIRVAAIGGIWAKSHRFAHYVTDEDVAAFATHIASAKPIDILLTHGCPVGLADFTPTGRHGGQRCFLDANKLIMPRIHLCGHLHVAQDRTLKDSRAIINVGATPEGSIAVIERTESGLVARRQQLEASSERSKESR